MPGVEVAEGASHVDREVVPLQAVLLCRAPHAAVLVLAAVGTGNGSTESADLIDFLLFFLLLCNVLFIFRFFDFEIHRSQLNLQ